MHSRGWSRGPAGRSGLPCNTSGFLGSRHQARRPGWLQQELPHLWPAAPPSPQHTPTVLAAWGVGARLRRGRGLLERSPVPAERAQKHPSSSQSLISKPILRSKEPALPGEMAASRAGAGSTQGEPGASCSARKVGNPPQAPTLVGVCQRDKDPTEKVPQWPRLEQSGQQQQQKSTHRLVVTKGEGGGG